MNDSGTTLIVPRKIPFWRTIYKSLRFVFINLPRVIKFGWLPFINIAVATYVQTAEKVGAVSLGAVTTISVWVLSCPAYAVFALRWYRFVILGDQRSGAAEWLAWRNFVLLGYFAR